MPGRDWACELARYNRWQDDKLYTLCEALGDDARREPRAMFFGDIHRTLGHILMVDQVLLEFALTRRLPEAFDPRRDPAHSGADAGADAGAHVSADAVADAIAEADAGEPSDGQHIDDFDALAAAQRRFDDDLLRRFEGVDDAWFDVAASFYSEERAADRHMPRWFIFSQLFNHATHHRSQVTSELHRLGIDYGNTDLPHNPFTGL